MHVWALGLSCETPAASGPPTVDPFGQQHVPVRGREGGRAATNRMIRDLDLVVSNLVEQTGRIGGACGALLGGHEVEVEQVFLRLVISDSQHRLFLHLSRPKKTISPPAASFLEVRRRGVRQEVPQHLC